MEGLYNRAEQIIKVLEDNYKKAIKLALLIVLI